MTTKEARREANMRASIMLQTAIDGWHWEYSEEDAQKVLAEMEKIERMGLKGAAAV